MWVGEGCKAVAFPFGLAGRDVGKAVSDYVKRIFTVAHEVRTLITLEPVAMPIRMGNVKRYVVLAPLSAIICGSPSSGFEEEYSVAEGFWARVGLVTPYTTSSPCGLAKRLGIALEVNESSGLRYLCTEDPIVDRNSFNSIASGGFIEVVRRTRVSEGGVSIALSRDPIQVFIKLLIDSVNEKAPPNTIRYESISVDEHLGIYTKNIALIGRDSVAMKVGRGYAFSADIDAEALNVLYHLLLLIAYTREVEPAIT